MGIRSQRAAVLGGMPPLLIARQPIVDRGGALVAYELLSRSPSDPGRATFSDGTRATAQLINEGIGFGSLSDLIGEAQAFVNFDRTLLISDAALGLQPPERFVVEVLEDVPADAEVIAALARIRAQGLAVALDDVATPERVAAFVPHVDWVKLDVRAVPPSEFGPILTAARAIGAHTLAEKVESLEEAEDLHRRGVDYFQGYFVGRPQTLQRTSLPSLSAPQAWFVRAVLQPHVDFEDVARAVSGDPALSYRLLTLSNAASAMPAQRVTSVRMAVVRAGELHLKRMAALLAFAPAASADGVQVALTATMLRASFAELIGRAAFRGPAFDCFVAGLVTGLEEYIGVVPGPEVAALIDAAVGPEGSAGRAQAVVEVARRYVEGQWREAEEAATSLHLGLEALPDLFRRALEITNQLSRAAV